MKAEPMTLTNMHPIALRIFVAIKKAGIHLTLGQIMHAARVDDLQDGQYRIAQLVDAGYIDCDDATMPQTLFWPTGKGKEHA